MNHRLVAIALMPLCACPAKKNAGTGAADERFEQQIVEKRLVEEDLLLQEIDLNGDGQADIFNYYRERTSAPRLLVRKKLDLNFDGRIDVISYFDDEGALASEQMDGDFDGHLDWTDHYQNGVRVKSEVDTDYDGRPNIFAYYRNVPDGEPVISRKERDTDGDGRIDYWELFDEDGNVVRTGRDTDGDGKMDERDE